MLRHAITWALTILSLMGCTMGSSDADRYFDSPLQLEAARAISAKDMARLRTAVAGLDIDRPGHKSMTLLWFAIHERNFEAIRFLISRGSNPQEQLMKGPGIPVEYALLNQDTRILAAMLDGGLSVDHVDSDGTALVQKAAGPSSPAIDHLKLLVQRGAKVNVSDSIGRTALDTAILTRVPDRALYLLKHGANWNTFTAYGGTPAYAVDLAIAKYEPGSEMRRMFEEVRDHMARQGAKFPADDSKTVRAWMKSQGMKVAE